MSQLKPRASRSSSQDSRKCEKHAKDTNILDSFEDENFLPENASIEADGEFDETEPDFKALATEIIDSLEPSAFGVRFGDQFHIVDETSDDPENAEQLVAEKKRYVIPKLKRPETETQYDTSYGSNEEKREWRKLEREPNAGKRNKNQPDRAWDRDRSRDYGDRDRGDRTRDYGDRGERTRDYGERDRGDKSRDQGDRDSRGSSRDRGDRSRRDNREMKGNREKHFPEKESTNIQQPLSDERSEHREERQSLFDSFAAEGLISVERPLGIRLEENVIEKSEETIEMIIPKDSDGEQNGKQTKLEGGKVPALVKPEDEAQLEIPMGRDSLVFVRDYYPWQVRVYPVSRKDMPRADFAQVWALADSSSIVWSDHPNFGGVAEFLLKDDDSIQKFMRRVLWHNYEADCITVEITQRDVSTTTGALGQDDGANAELDCVISQAVFRFHNTYARQLLKTYYPTPKGEVTERSLYVNNVGTGVSADLMKAIFPCALKISVAKPGKGATSTALVETESEDASVNYLVVYHQIRINNLDLVLSTLHCDWEGAKEKFIAQGDEKKINAPKAVALKRPSTSTTDSGIPRKISSTSPLIARGVQGGSRGGGQTGSQNQRGSTSPLTARGVQGGSRGGGQTGSQNQRGSTSPLTARGVQGGSRGGGQTGSQNQRGSTSPLTARGVQGGSRGGPQNQRGRGKASIRGSVPARGRGGRGGTALRGRDHGRPLLPDPVIGGGGEGLLPHPEPHLLPPPPPPPLLSLPAKPPGLREASYITQESDRRTAELQEIQQHLETKVMETRASLIRAARMAEVDATEVQLDYGHRTATRPHRPVDYEEEPHREPPRRTLLPLDCPQHVDPELRDDPLSYRRPRPPPERDPPSRERARREEDYGDQRPASRPRRYLLEAPPPERGVPEEDPYASSSVYNYDHGASHSHQEIDMHSEERPPLLRHAPLERPAYPEERRPPRSHEAYDYENHEVRRPASYPRSQGGYEEDVRHRGQPATRYRKEYDRTY